MSAQGPAKIKRSAFAGLFLRPLGFGYWGIEQTPTGVRLLGKSVKKIVFSEFAGPAQSNKFYGLSSVNFPLKNDTVLRVVGLNSHEAINFISLTNQALSWHITNQFTALEANINMLVETFERLNQPRRYPSACLLFPFLARANEVLQAFPKSMPNGALTDKQQYRITTIAAFLKEPKRHRETAIKTFIDFELEDKKAFFDTIESNPLTPEQRLAVITDEDATLILAGAGSGKTSVIVAKAAYLIECCIRAPEEILLMAFGSDAAAEMASRIQERSGANVDALTFHALGYKIIREVEGSAPALATHASDDAQFRALLRDILINDVATVPGMAKLILKWFSSFFWPYKSEWDFKTRDQYYQYVEAHELRTLQGERVKSFEELEIANWLYLNGIAYDYEPVYEHELPENNRRAYTPDFRLKESGVYIEHFGVRKSSGPEGDQLTTAPHVNRQAYLEGMEWKRKVHRDHGTILIETYSYERVEGKLTDNLFIKLAPYITPCAISEDSVFEVLTSMGQIDSFTQIIGTFLRHYKSSGTTIEQCQIRASNSKDSTRNNAFLQIFALLFEAYQKRLDKRIDFEDMIIKATEHVEQRRYRSPYRHLLVDEFQDISLGRARLLRALKNQHADARIFAVGDDWQSIYRFTGSDIHLMRDFGEEFGGAFEDKHDIHSIVDLGRTFRSTDKIALPARRFVLQNPSQITKTVKTQNTTENPAIIVAYYSNGHEAIGLNTALEQIAKDSSIKSSVLLLGRYKHIRPTNLKALQSHYQNLSLRFMTVHASKGLEADHVVILRATRERMGFPSEIVDDPLLDLVLPKPESFAHAEERRLFYVALTRARQSVTILTNSEKPSAFVTELIEHPEYQTIQYGEPNLAPHRCKECGGRMLAHTTKAKRVYYSCEHTYLCGEKQYSCSVCGQDIPDEDPKNPSNKICTCGAEFQACPNCQDGWLVERKGRYGNFLGCINYPQCKGKKKIVNPKKRTFR